MKKASILILFIMLLFTSCSKCYDCVETHNILDSNGNIIDQTEVHENVCTSDQNEITRKENAGAVCS